MKSIFSIFCLFFLFLSQKIEACHYQTVLKNPLLTDDLELFLTHIFTRLPSDSYATLIKQISTQHSKDIEIYKELTKQIPSITLSALTTLQRTLDALRTQKKEMAQQTAALIGSKKINGYLEIGTPGRYVTTLKKYLDLTGPCFVMPSEEKLSDVVENGALLKVGKSIPLTYDPIGLPHESLDLVTCFIGLHHAPEEKLDTFIASIFKILRPGGIFIIRDHDATEKNLPLLHVVHSVYNAGTGVSPEEESAEIRNFKPVAEWIKCIEKHGFTVTEKQMLQKNDPTANTLLCFIKKETAQDATLKKIDAELEQQKDYYRPPFQSYLTAPEWYSVKLIKDYGTFLEHTPWFDYPYIKSISSYWSVWKKASMTNYKKYGFRSSFLSSYALMNGFIGLTVTGAFLQLSALAVVPRFLFHLPGQEEPRSIQLLIKDENHRVEKIDTRIAVKDEYANGLRLIEIPRYTPFTQIIQKLAPRNDISILRIAGQKQVQIKIELPGSQKIAVPDCEFLYDYEVVTQKNKREGYLNVPLSALKKTIKDLEALNITILQVVDY